MLLKEEAKGIKLNFHFDSTNEFIVLKGNVIFNISNNIDLWCIVKFLLNIPFNSYLKLV